jgi:high affinity Mn2+ porin
MKATFISILFLLAPALAFAQLDTSQKFNLHFQSTYIYQYKPSFRSLYEGPNSLKHTEETDNSLTTTLFAGIRLWKGAELYINPEVAGGSGLSGAFGLAASTNGETFRVGDPAPTLYLARGYLQQTFTLDNDNKWSKELKNSVDDQANQLAGTEPKNYLRLMLGKYSLADIMDKNVYSNSPRNQFMNWSLMNYGAWDYAANLRGYTIALATIIQYGNFQYVAALATLPKVANGEDLNTDLGQEYSLNAEISESHTVKDRKGHLRLLFYLNNGDMGNYQQAILASAPGDPPNIIATRQLGRTKSGFGISADQEFEENVGMFVRISMSDGINETWCFTEADRSFSIGMNVCGAQWNRKDDNVGVALVLNGLSSDHRNYLKDGGLGFQLGDGKLNYSNETAVEAYYSFKVPNTSIWLSGDYQLVLNPGYNRDRGPVNVASIRVHIEL